MKEEEDTVILDHHSGEKSHKKKKTKDGKSSKKRSAEDAADLAVIKQKKSKEGKDKEKKKSKDGKNKEKKKSRDVDQSETGVKASSADKSSSDIAAWHKEHDIVVTDCFEETNWKPALSFADTALPSQVLAGTKNFSKPTPIQSVCWPILTSNRDIIGIAETGSGKTLAFGLPAINKIHAKSGQHSKLPSILVMTPTRELALQIQEQFDIYTKEVQCRSLCVFGGISRHDQIQALRKGVDIIVACPGRLNDLMEDGACNLKNVDYVVLDEADRLLDSGFEKEVRKILSSTAKNRQIAMFSATWPFAVEKLADEFLKKPVKVTIGSPDLGANTNIKQIVEVLDPMAKERRLLKLLMEYHSSRKNRILVFALYKKEAARLEQFLGRNGWNCICIQGDMSQEARTRSFQQFKSGQVPLLIATDVAARGLDIPKVEYVINFTFPLTIEDYVHRIGRTGRAGLTGVAHTFFTAHDKARSGELINLLKQTDQDVPNDLLAFGTTVKKKVHSIYGAFYKDIDKNVSGKKITFASDDEE